jgi:glycerol kinase
MVNNNLLMQFQADILDKPVVKPVINETTALGAAYAAGLAVGFYKNLDDLCANWAVDKTWKPNMDATKRESMYKLWKKAVTKTFDWVEETSKVEPEKELVGTAK